MAAEMPNLGPAECPANPRMNPSSGVIAQPEEAIELHWIRNGIQRPGFE